MTTTPLDRLTKRQCEIVQLASEGNGIDAIASRLGIERQTVNNQVSLAAKRLDLTCSRPLTWLAGRYVVWSEQAEQERTA